MLVFTRTKHRADRLGNLPFRWSSRAVLHGGRTLPATPGGLEFPAGNLSRVLVATDTAHGYDVAMDMWINYAELPGRLCASDRAYGQDENDRPCHDVCHGGRSRPTAGHRTLAPGRRCPQEGSPPTQSASRPEDIHPEVMWRRRRRGHSARGWRQTRIGLQGRRWGDQERK